MRILKRLKGGNCRGEASLAPTSEYSVARRKMVEEQLRTRGILDKRVLSLMEALPRHWFVEEALIPQAYQDSPLNIGHGQTISQPFTVALLAQALHLKGHEEVLEIGTGCGYQTAVLAGLARQVYSIERLSPLIMKARVILRRLQIKNVILRYGDGSQGWPEKAPFQAIVAAAVSPSVPKPLLQQLDEGGRLVVPVEREGKQLLLCVRREGSSFQETVLRECRFVKMIGQNAFSDSSLKPPPLMGRKVSKPSTVQNGVSEKPLNHLWGIKRSRYPQV